MSSKSGQGIKKKCDGCHRKAMSYKTYLYGKSPFMYQKTVYVWLRPYQTAGGVLMYCQYCRAKMNRRS